MGEKNPSVGKEPINTKLHSKADRGGDEESTQAYVLVRRGDNKDMQMKATWYQIVIKPSK